MDRDYWISNITRLENQRRISSLRDDAIDASLDLSIIYYCTPRENLSDDEQRMLLSWIREKGTIKEDWKMKHKNENVNMWNVNGEWWTVLIGCNADNRNPQYLVLHIAHGILHSSFALHSLSLITW